MHSILAPARVRVCMPGLNVAHECTVLSVPLQCQVGAITRLVGLPRRRACVPQRGSIHTCTVAVCIRTHEGQVGAQA